MHFFKDYHPAYRGQGRTERAGEGKEPRHLDGHVQPVAELGQRGRRESAHPAPLSRWCSARPPSCGWSATRTSSRSTPRATSCRTSTPVDVIIVLENSQMITFQAATGQLDFTSFTLETQNIPLLKLGERKGMNKVHIWRRLHVVDVAIQPNYNFDDLKYRDLVWGQGGERRFVRALSHAIDRDQMNEVIYFGRGTPSQVTAHRSRPLVRGALRQGAYPLRPGLFPRAAGRARPFRRRRRRPARVSGRIEADNHAGVHRLRDAEGHQSGTGAGLLARGGHRRAPQDHRAALAGGTGHVEQDADDGVARGQGDGHLVPALAGLVLSAPGGVGHDDVEPLGTVPPERRGTRRRAPRTHPQHARLGWASSSPPPTRRIARRPPRRCSRAHADNLWAIGTVGNAPASGGRVEAAQECRAERHLGCRQPLDDALPSGDLVHR